MPVQSSVKTVCWLTAGEVWPSEPEVAPVHEPPLEEVTAQLSTLSTFQKTLVLAPLRTSCGFSWRCPDLLPDWTNVMGGMRQLDEPSEQKLGASQVATLLVTHCADWWTMVSPSQV